MPVEYGDVYKRQVQSKDVKGELTETEAYGISEDFMKRFAPQYETVQKFEMCIRDRCEVGDTVGFLFSHHGNQRTGLTHIIRLTHLGGGS